MVVVGNPIMHHLFLGIDPTELGRAPFALAADGGARPAGPRARPRLPAIPAPGLSPALRRRPCRRRRGGHGAVRGPHLQDEMTAARSTSAPMPRSCWATGSACSPAPRRPGRPSRVPRSARPAGGPGRHRAGPHRPGDAGAALQGHRLRSLVGRAGLRRGRGADAASPASAARASSRWWPRCSWPASSPPTA